MPESASPMQPGATIIEIRPFRGGWVFVGLFLIAYLTSRDIDDQLAELDRVVRAFESLGCHAANMAPSPVRRDRALQSN